MRLISYQPQVSPWTSFDRLSSLRDLFDSTFAVADSGPRPGRAWAPPLDIFESADHVTVKLEVAGMTREDFDISLHDDNLAISGERKSETATPSGEAFRRERVFGKFSRTITLPAPVKADAVSATYADGVLTVTLPKAEEAKPRKIEVTVK